MTVRGFFNNVTPHNEQDLVETLIIEAIQQKGMDVQYLIREKVDPDILMGEAPVSKFTQSYVIEMYLDTITQYNGDGDIFTGFGLSHSDHAEFLVAARRFKEELDSANIIRPREGDLIYMPMSDSLWEISKVKEDHQYYQLGKCYQYRVVCNLFQYSHEEIATDSPFDFNGLSDTQEVQTNDGLKEVFSITKDNLADESAELKKDADAVVVFDPENPFA